MDAHLDEVVVNEEIRRRVAVLLQSFPRAHEDGCELMYEAASLHRCGYCWIAVGSYVRLAEGFAGDGAIAATSTNYFCPVRHQVYANGSVVAFECPVDDGIDCEFTQSSYGVVGQFLATVPRPMSFEAMLLASRFINGCI